MYSAIILICNMAYTECMTYSPPVVFSTEELCVVVSEANLPTLKDDIPDDSQVDYKCISWGVPS